MKSFGLIVALSLVCTGAHQALPCLADAPSRASGPTHSMPAGIVKKDRMTPQEAKGLVDQIPGLHFAKGIPTNFPIPKYANNVTKTGFINSTKGSPTAGATILTTDSPQTVYNWYQNACRQANWSVKVPSAKGLIAMQKKDPIYIINAEKDNQRVQIFCIPNHKDPGTRISISWAKNR